MMNVSLRCGLVLLLLQLGPALAAQNLVGNGEFIGGLAGWTQGGFTCNSGVQGYDVDGYEFSCDLAGYQPGLASNSDAGTVYAQVNGVEIARIAFGPNVSGEIKRAVHVVAATGALGFHNSYVFVP